MQALLGQLRDEALDVAELVLGLDAHLAFVGVGPDGTHDVDDDFEIDRELLELGQVLRRGNPHPDPLPLDKAELDPVGLPEKVTTELGGPGAEDVGNL